MISWSASLGAYLWEGPEAALNQHIFKVESAINKRFHYHLARATIADLQHKTHGSGMVHITKRMFEETRVMIPGDPLVQQEFATFIDTLESAQAPALSHIGSARRMIQQFRQSVLATACSGRLTADWRGDSLDEEGIPSSWHVTRVADLAAKVPRAIQSGPFGSNLLHSEFSSSGCLVIGIDNVLDGTFSMGRNHRISQQKFDSLRKYQARPLDVLITVMGTVGRVCTVPADIEPAIITKHVYRITVDRRLANPLYVALALRGHPMVKAQIQAQERGQTRPGINGRIVKALELTVPPLPEQEEIISRVDSLLGHAEELEGRIGHAESMLNLCTRSVLAKVFNTNGATSPPDE